VKSVILDRTIESKNELPISELKPGSRGVVTKLEGEAGLRHYLLEMGFTRGAKVEFIREAPLGDPIDLRIRGYRLSLRKAEAAAVIVTPTY
jgi:Fe2+ transport system protein FeoA